MKKFTLFWLSGKSEVIKGNTIAQAMNNRGLGNGSLRALDFYHPGDATHAYKWDSTKKTWESTLK